MTNDERNPKSECRKVFRDAGAASSFGFCHSFGLVIGHSDLRSGFIEGGRYCGLTVTRQKRIGAWLASDASSKRTRSQIVSIDEELISTPLDPAELQSKRSLQN